MSISPSQCFNNAGTNTINALATGTTAGATSYTWNVSGTCTPVVTNVAPNGSFVTISVSCCGIYTVMCTALNASLQAIASSTAYTTTFICPPNVSASPSSSNLCMGSPATITANGAQTYTWFPSNITGSQIVVTPTASTNYTVIGMNASGCTNTSATSIVVSPLPLITTSGSNTLCSGSSATIAASGAVTYTWSTLATGAQILVSPSTSTTYTVSGTNPAGCVNTATHALNVLLSPTVYVSGDTTICPGSTLALNASGAVSYSWSNGQTVPTIVISPTASVNYIVYGSNSSGCVDHDTAQVSVIPQVNPNFIFSNLANGQVSFTNTSVNTASNTTYTWSFGNGASSTSISPTITYTSNGVYTVTLTASSGCGLFSTSYTVSVTNISGPSCSASFTYVGTTSGNYTFTSTSGGTTPSTNYYWTFGSNGTYSATGSAGANPPVQTFTSSGTQSITLTIVNTSTFCTSTTGSLVSMTICAVHADFSSLSSSTTVSFSNLSTNTLATTTYSWNYGDGSGSQGINPVHTYSAAGFYAVTLIASNGATCSSSMTKTISVTVCNLSSNFTHIAYAGGVVQFNSASTNTTNSTTYHWNFGDGVYSYASSPTHTYNNGGTYLVTLKVQDTLSSCNDSLVQSINVTGIACTANSNFTLVPTNTPHYWTATPAYPYNVTSAIWYWGDGTQSYTLYASHLYTSAATYDICLSVTVSCGASSNYCYSYAVNKPAENSSQIVYINVLPPAMTTGITSPEADNFSYVVYPNPNSGEFNIHLQGNNTKDVFVTVYNIVGEIVYQSDFGTEEGNFTKTIRLENQARGIYFVRLNAGSKTLTQKIIIGD